MEKYLILYLVVILWLTIIIFTVINISKYPNKVRTKKLVWTNIVVLFPFFGLIIFHMIGKKNLASG